MNFRLKTILVIFLSTVSALVLFSCATPSKPTPTSEIPDRREFPVSADVSPCQDFFKYACGGAIDSFKLREDRSRHIFSFSDSAERVLLKKKEFLKNLSGSSATNVRTKQLKSYFASCTNTQARQVEENSFTRQEIARVQALTSKKEFAKYLTQRSLDGKSAHVSFGNIANLSNSDIYDFILMPSRMTSMPEKSYYENAELLAEFQVLVEEFFTIFDMKDAKERAGWVVGFEKDFIKMLSLIHI